MTTENFPEVATKRAISPGALALAAALFLAVVAFGLYGPLVSARLHDQVMRALQGAPLPGVGKYYSDCAAAHAAGVYSIRRGDPGYRPELDPNGDGFACTPFERRRSGATAAKPGSGLA
jgi:hypothetical protein